MPNIFLSVPINSNISIALRYPANKSLFFTWSLGIRAHADRMVARKLSLEGLSVCLPGKSMPILEIRTFILTEPKVVPLLLWAFSSGYIHVMKRSSHLVLVLVT